MGKDGNIKEGILGRFICAAPDQQGLPNLGEYPAHKKIPNGYFGVGSGLTDEMREDFWANRESYVGKLLHVQYQHLTSGKVPRFPVLMSVIDAEPKEVILKPRED